MSRASRRFRFAADDRSRMGEEGACPQRGPPYAQTRSYTKTCIAMSRICLPGSTNRACHPSPVKDRRGARDLVRAGGFKLIIGINSLLSQTRVSWDTLNILVSFSGSASISSLKLFSFLFFWARVPVTANERRAASKRATFIPLTGAQAAL